MEKGGYGQYGMWPCKGRLAQGTNAAGEAVKSDLGELRDAIGPDQFTWLLDEALNHNRHSGAEIGKRLRYAHRTLQGLAVRWALDLLHGMADEDTGTDPRNEAAIAAARKVAALMDAGELYAGYLL